MSLRGSDCGSRKVKGAAELRLDAVIEVNRWNGIKMRLAPRNRVRNNIEKHLFEFIWRRQNSEDLWNAFIKALSDVHYD